MPDASNQDQSQPDRPKEQPQQPERTGSGNAASKKESPEAQRGVEMQQHLARLVKDQQIEDVAMTMVWERAGLPDKIETEEQMQVFLDNVLPATIGFRTLQEEYARVSGSSRKPAELDRRYRGALFQVICSELLRHQYRNSKNTVALSPERVQEFFHQLYPDRQEEFHMFSVLHSIQGVSVPDSLLVTVDDTITHGPVVFSEMQATLDSDSGHYTSEVSGLQARFRQVRVNGPLRLAYRQDTTLLTMAPDSPAYNKSIDVVTNDLQQRGIPVELERYRVPLRMDTFNNLVAQTTTGSPRNPQR